MSMGTAPTPLSVVLFGIDDTLFALEEKHYRRYLTVELDFVGQRRARARAFVAAYGIELNPTEAEHWYNAYAVEYQNARAPHDDAIPCLDELPAVLADR